MLDCRDRRTDKHSCCDVGVLLTAVATRHGSCRRTLSRLQTRSSRSLERLFRLADASPFPFHSSLARGFGDVRFFCPLNWTGDHRRTRTIGTHLVTHL